MRPRLSVLSAVILLTACGGGGNSGGPSSMVGVTLVSASPPPGSTVTLRPDSGRLSAPVVMTFSVVSDRDVEDAVGVVAWMAGGEPCGQDGAIDNTLGSSALATLKANQPTTLMIRTVRWAFGCQLPTTTSTIRITVQTFFSCCDSPSPPIFSRDLPISYTFVASTPSGGPS